MLCPPLLDIGNVNNDLHPDLVFANYNGQRNTLCLGDGIDSFACNDLSADTNDSIHPALGDVNQDDRQDVIFANFNNQPNRVCLGDGIGNFTCSDVSTDSNVSSSVALGLVNTDNNLDMVFANGDAFVTFTGHRNRVCLGDGTGSFSCNDVSSDHFISNDLALGDVNHDGKLDAVFANSDSYLSGNGQRNRVCLGDGLGGFTCSDVNTHTHISLGVTLGYIDGDNNLDIVFANGDAFMSGAEQRDQVCLGNGLGGFTCSDISNDNDVSFGVALSDANHDGYLDAFFGNSDQRNRVCFGNGAGSFSCSDVSSDIRSSNGVEVGFLGFDITTIKIGIPANGDASVNLDGTTTYTPPLDFVGSDIFTYSVEGTVATVTIEIKQPNLYLPLIFNW
jgi:hypothetical protein